VAKGEQRLDLLLVIPPVAHEEAFGEHHLSPIAGDSLGVPGKRRLIFVSGPSEGEFAAWVGLAQQKLGRCGAAFLTRVPHFEHRLDGLKPRH
jgi:hypothetical protein